MTDFLVSHFQDCVWLAVFLLAMVPTLESKVAIPFGVTAELWGENALTMFSSFLWAFFGTLVPALLLMWVVRFFKNRTSGFVSGGFLAKIGDGFGKKLSKINQKNTTLKKCLLLATFVAVPLPLTGAYTGAVIAGLTSLKIWQAVVSVVSGHLISCVIVVLLCTIFENSVFYILIISLILIAAFVLVNVIMALLSYLKNKKKKRD